MAKRALSEDDPAFGVKVKKIVIAYDKKYDHADAQKSLKAEEDNLDLTCLPKVSSPGRMVLHEEDQAVRAKSRRTRNPREVFEPFFLPSEQDVKKGNMSKAAVARKQYSVGCDKLRRNDFKGALQLRDFAAEKWDEAEAEVKRIKSTRKATNSSCKNLRSKLGGQRKALNESLKNQASALETHWQEQMDEAQARHDADLDEARKKVAGRDARIHDLQTAARGNIEQVAEAKGQARKLETALTESKSRAAANEKAAQEFRNENAALKAKLTHMTEKVKLEKKDFDIERTSLMMRIEALKGESEFNADD